MLGTKKPKLRRGKLFQPSYEKRSELILKKLGGLFKTLSVWSESPVIVATKQYLISNRGEKIEELGPAYRAFFEDTTRKGRKYIGRLRERELLRTRQ